MQELKKWLQNQFQITDYTLTPLDKGISNHNSLLRFSNQCYVIRYPKIGHDTLQLSFAKEKNILPLVQDLDVPNILFDEKEGIKVTRFIPHCLEFHETKDPLKYLKAGKLLSTLHNMNIKVPFYFDPFKKILHYKKQILTPFIHFQNEQKTIERVKELYSPNILCHNDVVQGNILFSSDREYLIDWEYAAMNDKHFDIASFFSENEITDPALRRQFYKGYSTSINDETVLLFEALADILWGYWSNLLYEQRKEKIYKEIAFAKEAHYHKILSLLPPQANNHIQIDSND